MPKPLPPPEQILTMLQATPSRIATLTAGLSPAQLRTAPVEGTWSANDVLAHLRSCADMWGKCILEIGIERKPTLRAVNPMTWLRQTNYLELEFKPSLRAFTRRRTQLLKILTTFTPKDWERSATVTGAGKPLQRSVHVYAEWLATHERQHFRQFQRIANALREQ